jgi:hypothetical protein
MNAQISRPTPPASKSQSATAAVVDAAETRDGLGVAAAAHRLALERIERLYGEGFRFASARLEDNRDTLRALSQASTLQEQMAVWSRYLERTVKQYTDNLGSFAGIYGQHMRETVQDGAEVAQAAASAVAEVTPSPMAGLTPPMPGVEAELVAPEPAARKTARRSAVRKTASPKAAAPKSVAPVAAVSEAAKVEAAKPEAAKPEVAKPEAAKVEAAKPEAAKVEAAKPEAAKVEAAKPEAAKVEAAKPEAAKVEVATSDAAAPKAAPVPESVPAGAEAERS